MPRVFLFARTFGNYTVLCYNYYTRDVFKSIRYMFEIIFIFICAVALVIKGATFSTKYAAKLADSFGLSRYAVGFIVVAVISILPETFVAINAALAGVSSFGLGTLFGSNVADMTLIFTIIILFARRGIKIESKILKKNKAYPFLLFLPLILGVDGYFSRVEGMALVILGAVFYYTAFKSGSDLSVVQKSKHFPYTNFFMLLLGMAILIVGSHFTVTSAVNFANLLGINPILVGMLLVGLGTTMPELFFAVQAVKKQDDDLAVGDILGTVLADATVVVGVLALISPFSFPQKIIYITGLFMVAASVILFTFMRSGRSISRRESYALFLFWLIFVLVEFLANT